jgi:hypothetical protein
MPRNGEEEDRSPGEDAERRDGDGDSERLRGAGTGGDEGRGAGANLCGSAAGPIGSAAAASPAQRKMSASGNEKPIPSVPRRRKHARGVH